MEATTNLVILVDCSQTKYMARHYEEEYHEHNPILGDSPSGERVVYTCAGALTGNFILHRVLKGKALSIYQSGLLMIETGVVARNSQIGLKARF